MEENKIAVNTPDPAADQTIADDSEAKIAALEAENAKIVEESANWKLAALKNKKNKAVEDSEEDEDEKMRRIVQEEMASSRLAENSRLKDDIIKKALKENRELKLAQMNKNEPGAAIGTHSEGTPVKDTLVTPDQMAAFKARGWDDKKIERYKKNLLRYGK